MTKERNNHIACLVLKGRIYDSVGIEYGISRERVYQITKRISIRRKSTWPQYPESGI